MKRLHKWFCAALAVVFIGTASGCSTVGVLSGEVRGTQTRVDGEEIAPPVIPEGGELLGETEDIAIYYIGEGEDEYGDFSAVLEVVNQSERTLRVSNDDCYVNGLQCDSYWWLELTPGTSAEAVMQLENLAWLGIEEVTDIEFSVEAYDDEDWSYADAPEGLHIYPLGEDAAVRHERPKGTRADEIVRTDTHALTVLDVDPLNDWYYILTVYVENFSEDELFFSMENVQVDGHAINPHWSIRVKPGKAALSEVYWDKGELEVLDVSDPQQIRFTLEISETDDYDMISQQSYTYEP